MANFPGMSQIDLWKTNPCKFYEYYNNTIILIPTYSLLFKIGSRARPIFGKLIQKGDLVDTNFERILSRDTDIWKYLDKFSRNRSGSYPCISSKLNRYSWNLHGWVFQKSVWIIIRKTFWMNFPWFANKDQLYFVVRNDGDLCKTWIIVKWHGQG